MYKNKISKYEGKLNQLGSGNFANVPVNQYHLMN